MHRFRGKLTYSNVVATLALFIALAGGTAFAASQLGKESVGARQLKKEAVTPAKLSKASKATLTGPSGPTGATGQPGAQGPKGEKGDKGDTGAAGSAVAYARVLANGTLDTAHSKNIISTELSSITGVYCITPSVPVTNAVVTSPHVGGDSSTFNQVNIIANGDGATIACPSPSPVWVAITNGNKANEDHPFYILFN
ncbi:MAG: collagen-like protein [Actinobacteria bacterium]|nr:collagen-like protein [Actinomycetota bacterium]